MSADLDADLDAYVYGDEPWPDEEPPPPPTDPAGADRLLYLVRRLEADRDEIEATAQARIAEFLAWRDDRIGGVDRRIQFLGRSLEVWMRTRHAETKGKVKSVNLPSGALKLRELQPKLVVLDDEKAAAVVEDERPNWVATSKRIAKREALGQMFIGYEVELLDGSPPPAGHAWHEAWDICGWSSFGPIVVPEFRKVPHVVIAVPLEPSFSFPTPKKKPEAETPEEEEPREQ